MGRRYVSELTQQLLLRVRVVVKFGTVLKPLDSFLRHFNVRLRSGMLIHLFRIYKALLFA